MAAFEFVIAGGGKGTEVGGLLAGQGGGYDTVASFFAKDFGVGLKVLGDFSHFDDAATDGTLADRELVATYGQGGRLVGAAAFDLSDEAVARLTQLIVAKAPMPLELNGQHPVAVSVR